MQQEIKYGGFTATPNDYISPDGELAASIGVIPENGALRPVFPPKVKSVEHEGVDIPLELAAGERLLWIHRITGHTHYILLLNNELYWICEENGEQDAYPWTRHKIDGGTISGTPTIASIGNTLVVNDDNGVNYFLWSADREGGPGYTALGQKPPMLEITFGLHSDFAVWPDKKNTSSSVYNFGGADIKVGNIPDTLLPKLGDSEGDDGAAWACPRNVMATIDLDDNDKEERFHKFASESATFSVEELHGETDEEKSGLATFKNTLTNGVFARVNVFTNEKGTKDNKFVVPFFIRYCYRLYDDTFIMHSYPVLLIPNSRGPVFALDGKHGLALNDNNHNMVSPRFCGRVYGFLSTLVYSIVNVPEELMRWKDIVMSVDIGVSAPVYTYDQAGTVFGWQNMDDAGAWDEYYSMGKVTKIAGQDVSQQWPNGGTKAFLEAFLEMEQRHRHSVNLGPATIAYGDYFNRYNDQCKSPSYIATVPQKNISDINNALTGPTNFYIIKQFELDELSVCNEKELELDKGTLSGLLGRDRIDDDYRTHDHLAATMMYNYNGRINLAGVTRTPHAPINPAVQFAQASDIGSGSSWQVAVTVNGGTRQMTIQGAAGNNGINFPRWIYYPDVDAKTAYLTKDGTTYRVKLTPHDHLNGAYWLGNIMTRDLLQTVEFGTLPAISTGGFKEENKLYTSNVNNPWFFDHNNIKNVGYGRIIGICSAAKAMSQGQFGEFPLYAFTDEGVCALYVNEDGSFKPSQPFTRDVCINAESITQLDSAVLFATDRGIMLLQGSTSICITDAIFARTPFSLASIPKSDVLMDLAFMSPQCFDYVPLLDFIRECRMIYDYVNQRVIIYNPQRRYAYVYSLGSKQWGIIESLITDNPNSYPDALAVVIGVGGNMVVDYSNPDYTLPASFLLVTRPLKLGSGDVFKTVETIIQRGYLDKDDIKQVLYASNDLRNWQHVYSSRDIYLRGFTGSPYKYFRIALFGNLSENEGITGATVQFTPTLSNQLR